MDYFWKEHKKFALLVGGGLIFIFLFNAFVLSPIRSSADAAARKQKQERQALDAKLKQGVPSEDSLTLARRERDQARKFLGSLAAEIAFKAPDKFKVSEKERNLKAFYDDLRENLKNDLQEKAVKAGIGLPNTLGIGDDVLEGQAAEMLQRLAVVERLVSLAVESGVDKIEAIDALYGADDPAAAKKPAFLSKVTVFLRFSGKEEAVLRVLHGVQRKGSYLAVTHFDSTRNDPTKESLETSIAVALLRVDEKAPMGSQ